MKPKRLASWFLTLMIAMPLLSSISFAASQYPETLDDGNLVLVSGHMGIGQYADLSSVTVQQYEPPIYQIAINVVSVTFSDDHFRQYKTYRGSDYTMGRTNLFQFRYDWNTKSVAWYSNRTTEWKEWNINRDNSFADGQPIIPNTAEAAFVAAYNMRFFDDTEGYSPVLKRNYRVISETFYERLGI